MKPKAGTYLVELSKQLRRESNDAALRAGLEVSKPLCADLRCRKRAKVGRVRPTLWARSRGKGNLALLAMRRLSGRALSDEDCQACACQGRVDMVPVVW